MVFASSKSPFGQSSFFSSRQNPEERSVSEDSLEIEVVLESFETVLYVEFSGSNQILKRARNRSRSVHWLALRRIMQA